MVKKRCAAAAALALAFLASAFAAGPAGAPSDEADAADVIVLLDVSQSALPYFQDVTDYVVSSVVKDYLRYSDTFHLLSFGETAQSEIAQRMSSEADVKSVLGRLYLLYPLARYSDLVGALSYLYQYMTDLPESRRKLVVVITDGVHNPPPSSPTFGMAPEKVQAEIEAAAARIRANGWPVNIIRLPFPKPGEPGAPSSTSAEARGMSYLDAAAKALGAEISDFSSAGKADVARKSLSLPVAEFPGPLGKKDYSFSFPLRISNGSDSPVGLELDRVRFGEADILTKKAFLTLQSGRSGTIEVPVLVPEEVPQGEAKLQVRLHFANGVRVSPDTGTLDLTLSRSPVAALMRSGARVALFALILVLGLAAILAILIMLRRMPKRAEAPIAAAVLMAEEGSSSSSTATEAPAKKGKAAAAETIAAVSAASKAASSKAAMAAKELLGAAATSSAASEGERSASSAASAKEMAASRREEAARSAALLAEAAGSLKAAARVAKADAASAQGLPATERREDAHEAAIANETTELAVQKKAEAERTVAILAEASGRRRPAARPASSSGARAQAAARYAPRVVKPGLLKVELIVSEQNPHIGLRNVHELPAGGSKYIGGGGSDFLVFLVNVPRRSAEIHFDGEKLTFVPRRPELFPDLQGPVEDCLGKELPMISRAGYPLTLSFRVYERPADKLNRLLHCIDTTGL
jgi:hypothetical protein